MNKAFRLLFTCLLLLAGRAAAVPAETPLNPSGFAIHRGTNISHWLSQDFGWAEREQWFTEKDVQFIASQGFDHIRLPIDEKELWEKSGQPNEKEFKRLTTAIDWCRKAGLRVIVDLHTLNSHHFNAANEGLKNTLWTDPAAQEHFLSLWKDISARLHSYPNDFLAYEILNEPVADDHEQWNHLVAKSYTYLRSLEAKRVLIIGANRWQMAENLPFLHVPAGDKNIILSFHTYVPMLFTHYKADWLPTKVFTGAVHYPGPIVDSQTFAELAKNPDEAVRSLSANASLDWGSELLRREFAPAVRKAKEMGLQLFCGEFGCLGTVPRESRLAYYRDIVAVFASEGIAYANWEYKGDFGVYDWRGPRQPCGKPDTELLDILVPKK